MSSEIFLFILGVALLLTSSQFFVRQAERLSRSFKISALVIGTTIVAIGTSLPELVISLLSALRGEQSLALGNIVGSNITNILLVLPLSILGGKLRIGTTKTQRNILVLCSATGMFVFLKLAGSFAVAGPLLIFSAIFFSVLEYSWGVYGREKEDKLKLKTRVKKSPWTIPILVASTLGILFGGLVTIQAVELISISTGLSLTYLGLVLTAIATSLPELFVTVISGHDNEEKLAMGNILGSNIYNLALIGGIIALLPGFQSEQLSPAIWSVLITATLALFFIVRIYSGRFVPKWVGVVMLFFFLGYLYLLNP